MKIYLAAIILLVVAVACAPQERPACTAEAKLCLDGSAVGRAGPNCEFAPCPGTIREYKARDVDTCSRIRFTCDNDEGFSDSTGCGCLRKA